MRDIVGYIKVVDTDNEADYSIQMSMIRARCKMSNLSCTCIYSDLGIRENRHVDEMVRAEVIGISPTKDRNLYPELEKLLLACMNDQIRAIVVDHRYRLYVNREQQEALDRICKDHDIEILESQDVSISYPVKKRLVFYHYSVPRKDAYDIRPVIWAREIAILYKVASKHSGWEATCLYSDLSACRRVEFADMENAGDYDIILVSRFYHIKRKLLAFIKESRVFHDSEIRVISASEGEFVWLDSKEILEQHMNVAILIDGDLDANENLTRERLETFINVKTDNWEYIECFSRNAAAIVGKNQYDLLLVDSFTSIGDNINVFSDFAIAIDKPIYSLREGVIKIEKEPGD